ncbi:MAG TPA: methyl-accepting chemotaxis protein, partial [Geobacterales bacterium]|nr:methyl-accepting chemotaxis protein [Geobacterales bacterium]
NDTLDAVIGPLNVAAEYVDRISKGDIPPKISDNYNGDFNEIKLNLNNCIDNVNAMAADANMLVQAAVAGKLATRADATKHQGDFRKIVQGVNDTLDAVIGPLNVAAEYVDRIAKGDMPPRISDNYNGDFNEIKNNLNTLIDALNNVANLSKEIADGNLTVEARERSAEDVLMRSIGAMVKNLQQIVGNVRVASDAISSATQQIASGNADLSQRTEEQASALEETASSMEELTSTVKQNGENAQQANQLAITANGVANRGGEVIERVVSTMETIADSSRKISDIITVIDGIAFQTNILALNAAVEAARAGEQGRGFAVVAGEVRNLAQRSAAAAKEIKTLINDSVEKVEGGNKLVGEAGETIKEIMTSVKRVTDIMSEISAASIEQTSGIEQVNNAITQMDEVTQQNAAVVEEAASAAESLEEQVQGLVELVGTFRLADSGSIQKRAAARPVAEERKLATTHPIKDKKAANGYHDKNGHAKAKPAKAAGHDEDWKEF